MHDHKGSKGIRPKTSGRRAATLAGKRGGAKMSLRDFPESELVRLSQTTQVDGFFLGFDSSGALIMWKLRFKNRQTEVYIFAAAVVSHFAKNILEAAQLHKWKNDNLTNIPPSVFSEDWVLREDRIITAGMRTIVFSDAIVSAFQVGKDLYQAIRFAPEQATHIAELILEQIQSGKLRDIAAKQPPSKTLH